MKTAGELVNNYQIDLDNLGMLKALLPELAMCRYLLAQADYADLLSISQKVLAFAEKQGITSLIPQFYAVQGKAHLARGEMEAARKTLQSGLSLLEKTGGRWGYLELVITMVDLEEKAGNDASVIELLDKIGEFNASSTQ